eukprot:1715338-Alexandrium_andersonii.AAC.1
MFCKRSPKLPCFCSTAARPSAEKPAQSQQAFRSANPVVAASVGKSAMASEPHAPSPCTAKE